MNKRTWVFFGLALGVGLLIWFLAKTFPGSLATDSDRAGLVRAVAILALVGAGVFMAPRVSLKGTAKYAAIWIAIGLAVFAVYTIRDDLRYLGLRMMGELTPQVGTTTDAGALELRRGRDGHFHLLADVDGATVDFLVDTGASLVSLSHADAKRIGIDPATLRYDRPHTTASGQVMGAAVRIGRISAGPISATNVRASVLERDGGTSLLGMSFLDRMGAVEISGDTLTLRPR